MPGSVVARNGGAPVAVHEPAGVDGGEPFGQVRAEFRDPAGAERPGRVDPVREGRGGDIGGDHPGTFGPRIGVDDLDRVEAADHAGGRDVAGEPLAERGLPGVLRPDELDRDQAPGPGPAEEHLAHAALTYGIPPEGKSSAGRGYGRGEQGRHPVW